MAGRLLRLDAELVRRSLARSRENASAMIVAGRVSINGHVALKPATNVARDADIVVRESAEDADYVSRGGHKLAGALADFAGNGVDVATKRCLDAGASTGGFTDVLLRAGAREVVAVDVGYGQLAWSLQSDQRVQVHDRTNIRSLTLDQIGEPVDLVVGDLSFISLELVLDALIGVCNPTAELVLMVKPQFEVGKERLGKGGVVREPELRLEAVITIAAAAARRGWGAQAVSKSQLPGPSGNVEFFLLLRRGPATIDEETVRAAVYGDTSTNSRHEEVGHE